MAEAPVVPPSVLKITGVPVINPKFVQTAFIGVTVEAVDFPTYAGVVLARILWVEVLRLTTPAFGTVEYARLNAAAAAGAAVTSMPTSSKTRFLPDVVGL